MSIPESEWVWCGTPGHFIAARNCRFHLHTRVGNYRVSTVGDYYPPGHDEDGPPEEILLDRTHETMVFAVDGYGTHGEGDPTDWCEVDAEAWPDAEAACLGHVAMCRKWANEAGA